MNVSLTNAMLNGLEEVVKYLLGTNGSLFSLFQNYNKILCF